MENSPRPVKSRLTLNKRSRANDSPKTPIRIIESSDNFSTPSTKRSYQQNNGNNNNGSPSPYCTPVSRKRYNFSNEESPLSQDYDNKLNSSISLSQDIRSDNVLDVGWKWDESPKGYKTLLNKKSDDKKLLSNKILEKRKMTKKIPKLKNNIEKRVNEEDQGFFKFKQELLKIKSSENWDNEKDSNELDSSLKENENLSEHLIQIQQQQFKVNEFNNLKMGNEMNNKNVKEDIVNNDYENIKLENDKLLTDEFNDNCNDNCNELLNDTDTDNLLIEFSQKVEAVNKPEEKKIAIENEKITNIQKQEIVNDSFDDILLSIPFDDSKELNESKFQKNPISKQIPSSSKNSFTRYNSMPVSPSSVNVPKIVTKSFTRHNSMPNDTQSNNVINLNKNSNGSSSTNTCSKSEMLRNMSEEIEKRRQEAKRRLMLTKQRLQQQQQRQNQKQQIQNTKFK